MKIFVMPGHTLSGAGTGAVGYINEGNENRILSDLVVKYLKLGGADVVTGRLDKAKTSNYLAEQVAIPNKSKYDLVVQIHFNAYKTTNSAMGTETLYYDNSGKAYADRVTNKLGLLYKQRGSKQNQALYWLKNTYAPAILIETCFVDSKTDTDKYICNKEYTAKLIAEGILNKSIIEPKPPTQNTYYRVVTNSYTVRSYAEKEVYDLKKLGYSAFLDAFKKDNKSYLRVVAGSYTNRSNADKLMIELKNKGYNPFIAIYKK